ncbi:ribonuclease R, partial [Myxococcota bacterium]|nr:ribonuclease R [Myxococcota bacterium]
MDEAAILDFLRADPSRGWTLPEIIAKAGIEPEKMKGVRRVLKGLVKRGVLERERGRTYRISRAGQQVQGQVAWDERRGPSLYIEGWKGSLVTIAPEDVGLVDEGDRVVASLSPVPGRRGRLQAKIVEVKTRPAEHHLGVFRRIAKVTFVELDLGEGRPKRGARRPITEVLVPPDQTMNADDGVLVDVELTKKGRGPSAYTAAVKRILGRPGERETELKKLMIDHHLDVDFPPEVEEESKRFPEVPTREDFEGRRDVRALPLVTIDGETAKDFDDAVCAVRHGDGYILYVAIADVAHYVRPRTALDQEAFRRGTSTYLTDRAIPMLPEVLSNGLCSLKPHVDRLCMVVELTLDRTGHVEKTELYDAVMRSHARLTYTRVAKALEGEPDEECARLLPTLMLLNKVAALFLERRLKRGAIDLDLAEPQLVFDADGFPIDVLRRPRNDAHRLIEDLMLAANEAVATFFVERELPSLFRIHEDPDPDKLELFVALCHHLGVSVKLKKSPRPKDVALILEKVADHPVGKTLSSMLLRSLMQARYDAECKGHYGLAAERYLHFTSPIRRYPDLMVHRLLKRVLTGAELGYTTQQLQEIAQRSSEAERRAMAAERECLDLDRCYVALEHLGETKKAVITAVQNFGLFAATDAPFLEGLIPVSLLPEDYYEPDEHGASLRGANGGLVYALGQSVEVEIGNVNLTRRQIELHLVDAEGAAGRADDEEAGERGPRTRRGRGARDDRPARDERPARVTRG